MILMRLELISKSFCPDENSTKCLKEIVKEVKVNRCRHSFSLERAIEAAEMGVSV